MDEDSRNEGKKGFGLAEIVGIFWAIAVGISYLPSDWQATAVFLVALLICFAIVVGLFLDGDTRKRNVPSSGRW